MKKFILIFMIAFFAKNLSAQAIYGSTTVCLDQVDGAGAPQYVSYYTVNHPLLCDYCKRGNSVQYTLQSGGLLEGPFPTDCSTWGQVYNRVTTLKVVWHTPGTHILTEGWLSCGITGVETAAASITVNVSNGTVNNTTSTITGTSTSPLYPEPYVCDNNLSNFNINTNLTVGSCASSVSNQALYLDRQTTTGGWTQIASAPLYTGNSTRNIATTFGAGNLTGLNNQNIYRIRGAVVTNAPGTKTFTTPKFRVASIGAYNVDYLDRKSVV